MGEKTIHKIWPERNYTVRLYIVRDGNKKVYWWGIHPADLLLPEDSDYVEEGVSEQQCVAWEQGRQALSRWAKVATR